MKDILSSDSYRKYLSEYYVYNYDKDTFLERKREIDKKYSDEYLNEIINNTEQLSLYIIEKMEKENHTYDNNIFTSINILEQTSYICNGCIGGYHSDTLYRPREFEDDFLVSEYLLKQIFNDFKINVVVDVFEDYNYDEGIGSILYNSRLFISAPIEKYEEVKEKIKSIERKVNIKTFI